MTTAFDVLQGYIAAADPNLHGVLNQVARIVQHTHDTLEQHTQLNVADFRGMHDGAAAMSRRMAVVESILSNFGDKMDNIDAAFTKTTAELQDHNQKLDYLNGADGRIEQQVYGFADAVTKFCSDKYEPLLEQHGEQHL